MAQHIVGLDFGTRSIKLIEIDSEREPLVEAFDREPLPLDREPYVPLRRDEEEGADSSETEGETPEDEEGAADASGESGGEPETGTKAGDSASDDEDRSPEWVRALERLLARHEFREETLVLSFLPEGRAFSIHQDVPFENESKVSNILPNLLEDRLPLEPSEIIYDFNILSSQGGLEGEEEYTAVVGIGRRNDLGFFLSRLREADFDPAILGIPELMLRYVAGAAVPDEVDPFAVVDVGHDLTRVLVLQGGDPVLARSIEVAGAAVDEAIAEAYDTTLEQAEHHKKQSGRIVSASEANDRDVLAFSDTICEALEPLVRDLRRNFQSLYAQQRIELETIYVTGGTSRIENLETHFESEFGIPVETLDTQSAIDFGPVDRDEGPLMAMSASLGLQPIRDRSEAHLLDLRKEEFAFSGRSSYLQTQLLKYVAAAAVLLVLFCGALFVKKLELEAKERAMKKTVERETKSLFDEPLYSIDEIRNRAGGGKTGGNRQHIPDMSAYQVMYELMSRVPDETNLSIEQLDVDTSRNVTQLSGTVKSPSAVETLQNSFSKLDCVKDIDQDDIKVQSENKASFNLEISTNCR